MATNDIKERCSRCRGTGIDADIFDAQGNPMPGRDQFGRLIPDIDEAP